MLKQLAIKELRELAGLAALALVAGLYVAGYYMRLRVMPWQYAPADTLSYIPFVSESFADDLVLFLASVAIVFGLKQSWWESRQNTYHFLLHRPLSWRAIFTTKLVIGNALVLLIGAATVLFYARWAAMPGNHASPFEWSMTKESWWAVLSAVVVYQGAFLSGIHPGNWFGAKLLPLAAACGYAYGVSYLPWWSASVPALALGVVVGLLTIFYYVRQRDY